MAADIFLKIDDIKGESVDDKHKDEMAKTSACIVHDSGTGKVTGLGWLGRPALKPPGQARQDLWAIEQVGRRLGLAWNYWRAEDGDGHAARDLRVVGRVVARFPAFVVLAFGLPVGLDRQVAAGAARRPRHRPG